MEASMIRGRDTILWNNAKPVLFVYAFLVVLIVLAGILRPGFVAPTNIASVVLQSSFLGIVCIGQTLVILTAGIDLSVSFTITLCNIVGAQIMDGEDKNIGSAILVVILISIAIGVANGAGIHFLGIPSLIMTLGVGSIVQGVSYIYCQGAPKGYRSPVLDEFVHSGLFGLSGVVWLWIIFSIATFIIMKFMVFGRSVHALGTNLLAARYSGVNVAGTLISVYVISAVMAGLTGLLLCGYAGTSYLTTGDTYNMDSIAAVVIGGTSILGGKGSYVGSVGGAVIMTVLTSLLIMISVPESVRQILQGAIIIGMLLIVHGKNKN